MPCGVRGPKEDPPHPKHTPVSPSTQNSMISHIAVGSVMC